MRTLQFNVHGQEISKNPRCDFSGLYPGTSGYLQAGFTFSAEWAGMVKVAEFRRYSIDPPVSVPVMQNKCMIPDQMAAGRTFLIRIVGKKGNKKLTTGNIRIRQEG